MRSPPATLDNWRQKGGGVQEVSEADAQRLDQAGLESHGAGKVHQDGEREEWGERLGTLRGFLAWVRR